MTETITTKTTVKVKVGKKTVTKTITKTVTVLLASASYKLAKAKSGTFDLTLTATGHSVLAKVAKTPLHEALVATAKSGRKAKKNVIVS